MDDKTRDTQKELFGPVASNGDPFRAVLHPHRSLSPRGFLILMSILCFVSFATGLAFYFIGAWPVLGFFGLDVLIVYIAFKLNYRAARAYETIEVTPQTLSVERVHANGRKQKAEFNPYWVRVLTQEDRHGRVAVALTSHGRSLRIAEHLSDDERREFATALKDALLRLKSVV